MNGDLISREASKKKIDKFIGYLDEDMIYRLKVAIDKVPAVKPTFGVFREMLCSECEKNCTECKEKRPQDEWIPAIERLPEDMQRVLIWFEYYRYGDFNCMFQTYGFGYVCDGKWSPFINGETGWQDYRVIAWQPLPEPYKEGGAV